MYHRTVLLAENCTRLNSVRTPRGPVADPTMRRAYRTVDVFPFSDHAVFVQVMTLAYDVQDID
ncbi:MAG: hypothetical protein JKY17_02665 [Magnetovibrio sp.]|nr:hypothetical protein [Magnetovibrio sp.]